MLEKAATSARPAPPIGNPIRSNYGAAKTAMIAGAFVIARGTASGFRGQTDSHSIAARLGVRYLLAALPRIEATARTVIERQTSRVAHRATWRDVGVSTGC